MTISARIIADSIYDKGPRLTTMVLRYPRFIHAEFMTHRVFSRNASSSRAIPVQKMIDAVKNDPAMPVFWGKNQAGMQAAEELEYFEPIPMTKEEVAKEFSCFTAFPKDIIYRDYGKLEMQALRISPREVAKREWLFARDEAIKRVQQLMEIGLHKQIANRMLEPWMHIEVVVTATDWANFYALRLDKAAQPEMRALAQAAYEAHIASFPRVLKPGEWHLPFVSGDEIGRLEPDVLCRISAARCARVSYLKHDGTKATTEEDMELFDRLMAGAIKHSSPTEHQAVVPREDSIARTQMHHDFKSNLQGWIQYRKMFAGENISTYKEFTR